MHVNITFVSACAEGVTLGLFSFDKMKSKKKQNKEPVTQLIG